MNIIELMQEAVELAYKARFSAAPNPMVAAFLLCEGKVLVKEYHKQFGQAHAEALAIHKANKMGIDLTKCELLVSLEPCNHYGKTPPCVDLIIQSGIKKVYIGTKDPNRKASGGIEKLKNAGIQVEVGIVEDKCKELLYDFKHFLNNDLPFTILKLALSLDGKIALYNGKSQYISSKQSRLNLMTLRASLGKNNGAILIGANTFFTDNPSLTARISGAKNPISAVISASLPKLENSYKLIENRANELIFFTKKNEENEALAESYIKLGVRIHYLSSINGELSLLEALKYLKQIGINFVLCEGGGKLAFSLIKEDLVQELQLYYAPIIIGDSGAVSGFNGNKLEDLALAYKYKMSEVEKIGDDCKVTLHKLNK